jgi:branched-chain amino acid transport system substrate-binding protein
VSFRSIMNIYALMEQLGASNVTRASLLTAVRAARDTPSFNGHPYTCDGRQVPDLPALCAPQEILVRREGGGLTQITDWIDVPALLAG